MKTRVIAVANNKGGVAKTTTAGNLGYGLSRALMVDGEPKGYVLMVDLDTQGNLSDFFGVRARAAGKCVGNIIEKAGDVDTLRANTISLDRADDGFPRPNMFLLPASRELEAVTEDLILRQVSKRHAGFSIDSVLVEALAPLMGHFAYIVIDCPPHLDTLKTAVYRVADDVIVPCKTDYMSFQGAQQHTNDLSAMRQAGGIKAKLWRVVPTMVAPRQVLTQETLRAMVKLYGRSTIADPVPELTAVKESPVLGQSLFEYAPRSPAAMAYAKLVKGVVNG